ncbi:MAG: large-conductance mechanosensitive channel protein MscL [Bacteroidetes bacterium]|nr:MAG: large-conductance mechanosensitive channel protein MscL [Bacteroidota bacterium]TNE95653.1 MAG: large-conductance mechanosensitive channel protein MscL [Bacteroidota bacterium]
MLKEFRDFAMKGNVMDLAIAVIIGGAFGKIVTSLVNDILMPIIGMFIGDSFASLSVDINGVAIKYGAFLQATVDFVIIAFVIFMLIKGMNKMKKKKEEAPAPAPGPTKDQELLMEIRDLLKK